MFDQYEVSEVGEQDPVGEPEQVSESLLTLLRLLYITLTMNSSIKTRGLFTETARNCQRNSMTIHLKSRLSYFSLDMTYSRTAVFAAIRGSSSSFDGHPVSG